MRIGYHADRAFRFLVMINREESPCFEQSKLSVALLGRGLRKARLGSKTEVAAPKSDFRSSPCERKSHTTDVMSEKC